MSEVQNLFDFIAASPTPWHGVKTVALMLAQEGWQYVDETDRWYLKPGAKYFTIRSGSALIAWRMPTQQGAGWRMAAAHDDSPAYKIKGTMKKAGCTLLDLEGYGGMIRPAWLDRPLGIAGRVMVKDENGISPRLVDLGGEQAVIPHLAIHMDRTVNEGHKYDMKKDMPALYAPGETRGELETAVAQAAGCAPADILGHDLLLYCPQNGVCTEKGLILCPRIDDLACAFAALKGFMQAPEGRQGTVYCLFDNEEVGSGTRQGALSSFLPDVLTRAAEALGENQEDRRMALANSILLSADNGHAVHPNFAEMSDPQNPVRLGGGVVLKFNASQKYTTSGETGAIFRAICARAGVPVQDYYNRPDLPGGSTLGNLLSAQVSVPMADIGLPQLAMHSCVETAAAKDVDDLCKACCAWYEAPLRRTAAGWVFEENDM